MLSQQEKLERLDQQRLLYKAAIALSGKRQVRLAFEMGIREHRLSRIVNGWERPRGYELLLLERLLDLKEAQRRLKEEFQLIIPLPTIESTIED